MKLINKIGFNRIVFNEVALNCIYKTFTVPWEKPKAVSSAS